MAKKSNLWFLGITQQLKTFTAKETLSVSNWSNQVKTVSNWSNQVKTVSNWSEQIKS